MNLADFLHDAPRNPAPWNCSTFPADWCVALGHSDYAAIWRDVTAPAECEAAAASGEKLAMLWSIGIGDALPLASAPYQAGDIAVVARAGMSAGAIFDGERWALRTERGVSFIPLPNHAVVKAWRP